MGKKKLLIALLTGAMLITSGVSAFASNISVTGSSTGSTPSSFVATDDMLCNDVVVTIPAELILTYNSSTKKLTDSDVVTAQGEIKSGKHLEVSVPTSITYQNAAASSVTVNGALNFGSNGKEKWTPSQVETSSGNSRQITSTVDAHDLEYAGTYRATITYNFSIVND